MNPQSGLRVGEIVVHAVSDGTFVARPGYFGPALPASSRPDFFNRDGTAWLPIGCFLIRDPGGDTVLVDAGLGPDLQGLPDGMLLIGGQLLTGLTALGVSVVDISDVICTHLHSDHVGWLFDLNAEPIFPSATIWVGQADLELVLDDTLESAPHIRQGFRRYTGTPLLRPIESETMIMPGLTARPAPGHTPGSFLVEVSSTNRRLLLLGDAITCPIQVEETDWHSFGDMNPKQAEYTRTNLWNQLSQTDTLGIGAHFPRLQAGRVDTMPNSRRRSASAADSHHNDEPVRRRWISE
jgi:glyoxylase-like metal-dependent hydrolase (beta-lactamase superfamily II)